MKEQMANVYLDFVNNFLTRKGFALHYGITERQAGIIIDLGRELHEERVERYKIEG